MRQFVRKKRKINQRCRFLLLVNVGKIRKNNCVYRCKELSKLILKKTIIACERSDIKNHTHTHQHRHTHTHIPGSKMRNVKKRRNKVYIFIYRHKRKRKNDKNSVI